MSDNYRNLEIVRDLYARFSAGEISSILELLSPDVEWCEPENPFNPAAGTRRGHDGFLDWANIGNNAEEILVLEPRQMLTNDESVAVVGYIKCLARQTGKTYESDFVHLITIRNKLVVKFQEFFDTYAAGEAFCQQNAETSTTVHTEEE